MHIELKVLKYTHSPPSQCSFVFFSGEVQEPESQNNKQISRYVKLNHFENQIIGDKNKGVMTRRRLAAKVVFLISKIEPKVLVEAQKDEKQMKAMEEELNQIEKITHWNLCLDLKT